MRSSVQRGRLMALLLLLLTPGLGGWAVQTFHPCPSSGAAHHHQSDGHHESSGAPEHESRCHCIGSCHATPAVAAPSAVTVAAPIPAYRLAQARPAVLHFLATGRHPDLHPPATAPPVRS
ncbi:MAG TPA: hypothetical protein VJQ46_16390 [Gemmatimonadales bacterium]|nr:hypothetical protein [Gemmatimonadales bacterium]